MTRMPPSLLFVLLRYTVWRYVFIALALWPFVFVVQTIRSRSTNPKWYLIIDALGVLSVVLMTSVWALLIYTGDSELTFRIASFCAIPLSALGISELWKVMKHTPKKVRG